MASQITMQIKSLDKLVGQINGIQQKGETAVKRTISDAKSRIPGKVATAVRKKYSITPGEVNPNSKAYVPGKSAVSMKLKGETVATLTLVYKGRVLTPYGHGFTLAEKAQKNGRSKIELKIKKDEKKKQLRGQYDTVFMAGTSKASSTRIPFQRIPTTGAIEAIRTVAVPEMITNEEVAATIEESVGEEMNKRVQKHFKDFLK